MKEFCVIIPAVKKNVAFPDDLIKKINGISLIQRAINKAKNIAENNNIFVVTDSEEISLISERNEIKYLYRQNLKLQGTDIIKDIKFFLLKIYKYYKTIIVLWAYTPLVKESVILNAYNEFVDNDYDVLITLKEEKHKLYKETRRNLQSLVLDEYHEKLFVELKSFLIFKSLLITSNSLENRKIYPFVLSENELEIRNYQDWWICDKLLQRNRIVFRVIGNDTVGMGHIYRTLSFAHEITDHEIIFVCDEKSRKAVNKIAGHDYRIITAKHREIGKKISSLKPDLVINDTLNTTREYILGLKNNNTKVVSFEDLGSGAKHTDLTINELYDEALMKGNNIKWGHKYFFLRDEFNDARKHRFKSEVDSILITFGGTDQNNLTQKTLEAIVDFCKTEDIKICIVTGGGYIHKEKLGNYLANTSYKNIEFTYATGVMSKIMEKSQIAISSNGRTVYELAHMKIPSIIVSHHERENTHLFSKEENGFINMGVYKQGLSEKLILEGLEKLVYDNTFRKRLFDSMKNFSFTKNKTRVVKMVLDLLRG